MSKHWQQYTEVFLSYMDIERGAPHGTIKCYRNTLKQFFMWCETEGIENITHQNIRAWLAYRRTVLNITTSTMSKDIQILKRFFRFLVQEQYIAEDPTANILNPKLPVRTPQFLTDEEIGRLIRAIPQTCKTMWNAIRDRAIITLYLGTGMRLNELRMANLSDLDVFHRTLRITRKGGEEKVIPIAGWSMQFLVQWLGVRETEYDVTSEALFVSNRGVRLSSRALTGLIERHKKQAGIDKPGQATLLRHTFATQALLAGVSIRVVQELMNHKNLSTTEKYLGVNSEQMREAVDRLNF